MDFQGTIREGDNVNLPAVSNGRPTLPPIAPTTAAVVDIHSQRPSIQHAPFFQGFYGMGSQLPFLFHHPFMAQTPGPQFAPSANSIRASPIDLTGGSQKQAPEECITDQSKPTKKRRIQRKKPEIVELDDIKDEGDVPKNVGHWKDHWVIQLITVRGEMQGIFSAPPKQGKFVSCFSFFFVSAFRQRDGVQFIFVSMS